MSKDTYVRWHFNIRALTIEHIGAFVVQFLSFEQMDVLVHFKSIEELTHIRNRRFILMSGYSSKRILALSFCLSVHLSADLNRR